MGKVLEMSPLRPALAAAVLWLAGCGSEGGPPALPIGAILKAQLGGATATAASPAPAPDPAPDPAMLAEARRALGAGGKPVISVTDRSLGLATFMVPLGENGGVVSWANPEYQTIAMRDGVMLATRGFGRDLISAEVPTAEHLRNARGGHRRVHYVLDGADQTLRLDFDCRLSVAGTETISILGLSHLVRRVDEVCTGAEGALTNSYWFDTSGRIRQSRQVRALGAESLIFQAIID
ncbi:MAG: YjbF family lipoprotein [Paracoccaceae bacterium]